MFILIGISTPIMIFSLLTTVYPTLNETFRNSLFQIISAISTTSYATVSFNDWTPFALFLMIILMIMSGGAGSTSGDIKLYRILLLCKQCIQNLKMKFKSEFFIKEDTLLKPEGKIFLESSFIIEASTYAFAYLILLLIGTFIFLVQGYPLQSSLFEFSSALKTNGLSIGITSATTPPSSYGLR